MFACMFVHQKFVMMDVKLSVDLEDHEFKLLCIFEPEASVFDHTCTHTYFTLS